MTHHLDEDAELYALGYTERERDAEIEAHLAVCDACRTRVVQAEAAAASLAGALPADAGSARGAAIRGTSWRAAGRRAAAMVFAATTAFEGYAAHGARSRCSAPTSR